MSEVKRYDISGFGGGMIEAEDGVWYHADDYDALAAECQRLREALDEAAQSLETIERLAGRDDYMKLLTEVRGYAGSRAGVARAALAGGKEGE